MILFRSRIHRELMRERSASDLLEGKQIATSNGHFHPCGQRFMAPRLQIPGEGLLAALGPRICDKVDAHGFGPVRPMTLNGFGDSS